MRIITKLNPATKWQRKALRQILIMHNQWADRREPPVLVLTMMPQLLAVSAVVLFWAGVQPLLSTVIMAAACATGLAIRFHPLLSARRTLPERIDCALSNYQPVDIRAFHQLQNDVKECGELTPDLLGKWLEVEYQSLIPHRQNTVQYTFTSRIIRDDKDPSP